MRGLAHPKPRRRKGDKSKNAKVAFVGVIYTLKQTRHGWEGRNHKRVFGTFESHEALLRCIVLNGLWDRFTKSLERTKTHPRRSNGAPNSSWMGGAVLGAGFVLLGGIATAIVLRAPALNTSVSASAAPPTAAAPPAPAPAAAPPDQEEPPKKLVAAPPPPEAPSVAPPASRASIASFQAGLHQLDYETGPIDGVIGPRTTAAIKAFQYAEPLTVDGTLSAPTRTVLSRRIGEP